MQDVSEATMTSLRLATVNGLRTNRLSVSKRRKIFTWLKKLNLDFVFLQETHADETCERLWLNEWGGEGFFANGTDISRGVAILLKPGFRVKVMKIHRDPTGRFVVLELTMQGAKLVLCNDTGPIRMSQPLLKGCAKY